MKEGQTSIFYMAADSRAAAESAPFVEQLVRRDYEVSHGSLQAASPVYKAALAHGVVRVQHVHLETRT